MHFKQCRIYSKARVHSSRSHGLQTVRTERELSRAPEEDASILDDADRNYDNLQANLGAGSWILDVLDLIMFQVFGLRGQMQ